MLAFATALFGAFWQAAFTALLQNQDAVRALFTTKATDAEQPKEHDDAVQAVQDAIARGDVPPA